MRGFGASESKKISSLIIALLLSVLVLFSAFYIIAESSHDCTGEDCPICVCIQICEHTLHQIGSGIIALTTVAVPAILFLISISLFAHLMPQETPVSRKVRLND